MINVHPIPKHIYKVWHENSIAFLDILLFRRGDGPINRKLFRENIWTGQYIHFYSFTHHGYKINLIRYLSYWIKLLYPEDDCMLSQQLNQYFLNELQIWYRRWVVLCAYTTSLAGSVELGTFPELRRLWKRSH